MQLRRPWGPETPARSKKIGLATLLVAGMITAIAIAAEEAEGGVIGGAARGAAAGVIIGAIAGDAGKGAAIGAAAGGLAGGRRSRRAKSEADSQAQAAIDEFNRGLEKWDRNYAACMGSKDYNVN